MKSKIIKDVKNMVLKDFNKIKEELQKEYPDREFDVFDDTGDYCVELRVIEGSIAIVILMFDGDLIEGKLPYHRYCKYSERFLKINGDEITVLQSGKDCIYAEKEDLKTIFGMEEQCDISCGGNILPKLEKTK